MTPNVLAFFNIWPCRKKSRSTQGRHVNTEGDSGVPMQHTKVQGYQSIGSRVVDF